MPELHDENIFEPEELARRGKAAFEREDYNAALLETVIALEVLTNRFIVDRIDERLPKYFGRWIVKKVRNSFPDKLNYVVSFCLMQNEEFKQFYTNLYDDVRLTREARNRIAHGGIKIQRNTAQRAIATYEQYENLLRQN